MATWVDDLDAAVKIQILLLDLLLIKARSVARGFYWAEWRWRLVTARLLRVVRGWLDSAAEVVLGLEVLVLV